MNEIEESSKAIQEIAKTSGKAIDAGREAGGFLARVFGGSLEQVGGMIEDTIRFRRSVRFLRLMRRFDEIRAQEGITGSIRPIQLKFGVHLIESASLEEDDSLQDMFARLLVNATDPNQHFDSRRAFVSILQDFGPLEARLIQLIYDAPIKPVNTTGLPESYVDDGLRLEEGLLKNQKPTPEVEIALWNLIRLGCVEMGDDWSRDDVSEVIMTTLGYALMEACLGRPPAK